MILNYPSGWPYLSMGCGDLSFLESPHSALRPEITDEVVPVHFVHESSKVGQVSTRTERSELVFGAG